MRASLAFFSVLFVLLAYTAFKLAQLWPAHRWLAALVIAPLFFLLMVGWQFLYRSHPEALESGWFRALAWSGSISMGLWATYILLSLPVDLAHLFFSLFERVSHAASHQEERRVFLSRAFYLSLLGVSGGMTAIGLTEVVRGPRVKPVKVPIAGLPEGLCGLRIAQISDLHVGPTVRAGYVEEVVNRTNATRPDLIVVTGDLADGKAAVLLPHLAPLARLEAKLGVFYVTGNHEYYWGAEEFLSSMQAMGMQPLVNENRVLEHKGARLLLAGVTDTSAHHFMDSHRSDPEKALRSPERAELKILLAHRPESCVAAEPLGYDLQLSGHTHAGQFFPFSLLMPLAHPYYQGLHHHGRLWLYVNQGTAYWGPANRFALPPEISLLTLECSATV